MTMPPRIAVTEAQIDRVVAQFYSAVRQDPNLAPIFAAHVTDWPTHEEKIGRFWRNALLLPKNSPPIWRKVGPPWHIGSGVG